MTALEKAICKSRPGHLFSSAWWFWIVHECDFRLQKKNGFQYLCQYGRFSKIQSHLKGSAKFETISENITLTLQKCEHYNVNTPHKN